MIKVQGEYLTTTVFPDNTSQVWKLPAAWLKLPMVVIEWHYDVIQEFFDIAQLKTLLNEYAVECILYIDYLPYARQDKHPNNDSTFALHTFARLLNTLKFKRIVILDPHSVEAFKLINQSDGVYPSRELDHVRKQLQHFDVVAYPDAGALQKYAAFYEYPYVWAHKTREASTGEINGMSFEGYVRDKDVMIVDDICDGGATFIKFADLLYHAGAKTVSLFVTHGLFTKGLFALRVCRITRIFTAKGEVFPLDEINTSLKSYW